MIVVYYGVNLSLSLFFFPSSSSAYAPILISISSIVLRLISSSLFPSRLHPLPVFQSRRVPPALALPLLFFFPSSSSSSLTTSQSYPLPCFSRSLYVLCLCPDLHPLRCLSLSFCILNCPYPASFPFLALRSIPPGLLLYLIFHFLPATQSCPSSFSFSFSFSFSSGLYFCAPDVLPVANIVFLPPPLDMAKEAICALLAILEHFFEAFSPLDLFFAPSPFRPVLRPFPAFLHPGCRRFPSSPASVA